MVEMLSPIHKNSVIPIHSFIVHFLMQSYIADGTITAQLPNPAMTTEILQRILKMQKKTGHIMQKSFKH